MIKKASALIIILLANIILFAHAVIPHYHHKTEVCIESFHHKINDDATEHKTTEPRHEHNDKNSSDYCASQQAFLIPVNQIKQETQYTDSVDANLQLTSLQAGLSDKDAYLHFPTFLSNVPFLFFTSARSSFASTILGLRAPPVV